MRSNDAHRLYHILWSKAAGAPGYHKPDWKTLGDALHPYAGHGSATEVAFWRLWEIAKANPDYDDAEWRALGDEFRMRDD